MKNGKMTVAFSFVAAGLLALPALGGSRHLADRLPVPDLAHVEVRSYSAAGSGCIDGEGVSVLFDGDSLVFKATELKAVLDQDLPRSSARKFCQVIVDLNLPEGMTYAIAGAKGSLVTSLGSDVTAQGGILAYFDSNAEASASIETDVTGRATKRFDVDMDSLQFAPCDVERALKLKLSVSVVGSLPDVASTAKFGRSTKLPLVFKQCESV